MKMKYSIGVTDWKICNQSWNLQYPKDRAKLR